MASDGGSKLEVRAHVAALYVSLLRAGMTDAADELLDWARQWVDDFDDESFTDFFDEADDAGYHDQPA